MPKGGDQEDQKDIVYNNAVDNDEIDHLNKDDVLHLRNDLADNNNNDKNDNSYSYINISRCGIGVILS